MVRRPLLRSALGIMLALGSFGCRAFVTASSPEAEDPVPLHDIDDPKGAAAELQQIEEELGPHAYDRSKAVYPGPAELEVGKPGAPR